MNSELPPPIPEGTDDIITDPSGGLDLEEAPRRRKRGGWTGFDARAHAKANGIETERNVTPAWAGMRPGQHAALPLKPPVRR